MNTQEELKKQYENTLIQYYNADTNEDRLLLLKALTAISDKLQASIDDGSNSR